MQGHFGGKVLSSIFFPNLACCAHFLLFQMALVMQPALFHSWPLHYFLTSLINFQHICTASIFWTGTWQEMDKNNHAFCLYGV